MVYALLLTILEHLYKLVRTGKRLTICYVNSTPTNNVALKLAQVVVILDFPDLPRCIEATDSGHNQLHKNDIVKQAVL